MGQLKFKAAEGAGFDDETADKIGRIIHKELGENPEVEDVVWLACEPDSPLHGLFTWDEKKAARKYWEIEASNILDHLLRFDARTGEWSRAFNCIQVTRTDQHVREYVPITVARAEPKSEEDPFDKAWRELWSWRRRHAAMNEEFSFMFEAIDEYKEMVIDQHEADKKAESAA